MNAKRYAVWWSLVAFLVFLFLDGRHLVNSVSESADEVKGLHKAVQITRSALVEKTFERLDLRELYVIGPRSQMMIYPKFYRELFGVPILPHVLGARKLAKLRKTMGLNLKILTLLYEFENLFPICLTNPFLRLIEKSKLNFNLSIHNSLLNFFWRRNGLQINL